MIKRILIVSMVFCTISITFADCNYNFEMNNTTPLELTVSTEKNYYVDIKRTIKVNANSSKTIQVVGRSSCGSHATDLILKITSEKNSDSNKLRIHQTEGGSNFFDVFLDDIHSASKIDKRIFFENNVINVVPLGLSFGSIASSNWMGKISDNINLSSLIMPGSHDAGMSVLSGCTFGTQGLTKTQYLDISGQLMSGARYFDIRPSYSDSLNSWVTYHRTKGLGCNGQSILNYGGSVRDGDIMKQANDFIKAHPSETVILHFSHPRFSNDVGANKLYDDLSAFANADPSILVTNDKSTMLSDLRGHIVLVLSDDIANPKE